MTALVEEVEVSILIILILFTVTEKLSMKSSLKKHLFKFFYQFHISDHQINNAKILSNRRRKIRINFVVSAFKVVQDINNNRSNASIHLFSTFKYCQLQSFHDFFEIDKIFLNELDDLVRNIMISDFEYWLIHRFIWSSSFYKFYASFNSFPTIFRIDNSNIHVLLCFILINCWRILYTNFDFLHELDCGIL